MKIFLIIFYFIVAILCFTAVSFAAEKFVRKYDKRIDITHEASEVKVGRYDIKVDMVRPAKPFKELVFRIFVERNGKPVALSNAQVKFNMVMDMGLYKARLQKAATGYSAIVTLPKCIFGGHRWFMKLSFEEGNFSAQKVFLFDMDKN
ncbi:MAG: hypothetical protein C0603_02735 [Denitrovibrio sp.]|nr:MAG: hypothetical protein C0603_02735 [Denitrovibrio sp.]